MTKRGIYHNLKESEYATSNGEVALFFSSQFYLGKFMSEYRYHRKVFRKRMNRAMKLEGLNTDLLADINLYKEIEKRGFRVELKQNRWCDVEWQELNQFALDRMIKPNTKDWYEMHVPK